MEGGSGVTRSIIYEVHFWDFEADPMECESGVTRRITDERRCSGIQGDQLEGESGFTRSNIETFFLRYPRRSNRR